jgi:hypothetical protein
LALVLPLGYLLYNLNPIYIYVCVRVKRFAIDGTKTNEMSLYP